MKQKILIYSGVFLLLYLLFRKPLTEMYMKRVSGIQAAQNAATMTSYTTYNTQLYTSSPWRAMLNYFKPNATVPLGSNSPKSTESSINYSVQD